MSFEYNVALRGGVHVDVAGSTVDRKTRVRFPAYPHRVWALMARRLKTSSDVPVPVSGRLGTLKTPSYPWRWVPGSWSKFVKLDNCPGVI